MDFFFSIFCVIFYHCVSFDNALFALITQTVCIQLVDRYEPFMTKKTTTSNKSPEPFKCSDCSVKNAFFCCYFIYTKIGCFFFNRSILYIQLRTQLFYYSDFTKEKFTLVFFMSDSNSNLKYGFYHRFEIFYVVSFEKNYSITKNFRKRSKSS